MVSNVKTSYTNIGNHCWCGVSRSWFVFVIWLLIMYQKDKRVDNYTNENFDRNCNSCIEFNDVLLSAESAFEEAKRNVGSVEEVFAVFVEA